jgi:hypothetical protein
LKIRTFCSVDEGEEEEEEETEEDTERKQKERQAADGLKDSNVLSFETHGGSRVEAGRSKAPSKEQQVHDNLQSHAVTQVKKYVAEDKSEGGNTEAGGMPPRASVFYRSTTQEWARWSREAAQ